MSDRQVRIIISADVANAIRGMRDVEAGLGRVGQSGERAQSQTQSFGDKLKAGLGAAGVVGGLAGVAAGIGYVIKQGTSFQDNMNSLKAVTGASAAQMDQLSAKSRELGKDIDLPATSAGDASQAMLELAKGGLSVNDSMAAAKGTLLLAAAAQVSGAEAAQIQANALNAFALKGADADRVANVLANTANAASGSIQDFAAGMQQSATVAHSFGISIEDNATVLGLFAKAGLQGSDGGTSFKTMLTSLASPTKQQTAALKALNLTVYDANGNFVGMRSVTEQLAEAHKNLTQQQYNEAASTAFGSDAIRGANILAEAGVVAWDDMSGSVHKAGGVVELAGAQTEGVSGAFGNLQSKVEDASLTLFEKLAPALEATLGFLATVVGSLGDAVTWFGQLPAPIQAGAAALTALILLKGPVLAAFTAMKMSGVGLAIQGEMLAAKLSIRSVRLEAAASGGSMGVLGAGMRVAGVAAIGLGQSLKAAFLSNPIGLALVAATTALTFFIGASQDAQKATSDFSGAIDENTGLLKANSDAAIQKAVADSGSLDAYTAIGGKVQDYTGALKGLAPAQDAVHTAILAAATAAVKGSDEYQRLVSSGHNVAGGAAEIASGLLKTGDAGAYAGTGMDAAIAANAAFASDADILATQARHGAQATEGLGTAAADAAGGMDAAGAAAATAADPMQNLADATKGMGSAAAAADTASQFLIATLDQLSGGTISAEQAARLNAAAFRDIGAAQRGVADAQQTLIDKQNALTKLQKDGKASASDLAAASRDVADASDKVKSAQDGVFDSGVKARDSALKLAAAAFVQKGGFDNLHAAMQAATAVTEAQRKAWIAAQPQADRLSGKAKKVADELFGIPGAVATSIKEQGADHVQGQAVATKGALDNIPRFKTVTLDVNGNAQFNISNIQQALDAMTTYKQIVIETLSKNTKTIAADGAVFDQPFAGGGVPRISGRGLSQVRIGSGDGVRWGEAQTGKEFYLSMKPSMRDRNRGLASAAVNELGGQAMWGAGDIRSAASQAPQQFNVHVTFGGDGVITSAMASTAAATVSDHLHRHITDLERSVGQSR